MRITIIGAGPVGLLTACLLSDKHIITVIDKSTRSHSLNISRETVDIIIEYLNNNDNTNIVQLKYLLND